MLVPLRPSREAPLAQDSQIPQEQLPLAAARPLETPSEPPGGAGRGWWFPSLGWTQRAWPAQCHQESWLLVNPRGPGGVSHPAQTHGVWGAPREGCSGGDRSHRFAGRPCL